MKVLVVGGGSGGHITPAMSVIRELLLKYPNTQVEFWTDRKYYKNILNLANEMSVGWGEEEEKSRKNRQYIRVRKVFAGKFRRYHGLKLKDYFDQGARTFFDVMFGNIAGAVDSWGCQLVSWLGCSEFLMYYMNLMQSLV